MQKTSHKLGYKNGAPYATSVFAAVTATNTLIPKTPNKNHVIEVFVSRAFTHEIWRFEARNPGTKTAKK